MTDYATSLKAVVENSSAGITARNAFVPLAVTRLIEADFANADFDTDNILADLCVASGVSVKAGKAYRATMLQKGSGSYTAFTNLKTIWDNRQYALPYVLAYGRYVPEQMHNNMNDEMDIACGVEIANAKQTQHELSEAMDEMASYSGDNSLTIAKLKSAVSKAKAACTKAENICAAKVKEFTDAYIAAIHDIPAIPASVNAIVTIVTQAKSKAKAPATPLEADSASDSQQVASLPDSETLAEMVMANPGENIATILKLASDCVASLDATGLEANADILATIGDAIAELFANRAANVGTVYDKTGTNG